MLLHHYTSVNTLALILKHQTLRFTRLDRFDDVTESRSIGDFPVGQRLFASCWSGEEEESIPQWAMYGDGMKGIRLSLRSDPFVWQPIDIRWHEQFQFIDLEAPFSIEEMLSPGVTLMPTVRMRSMFGQAVQYVSDVPAAIKNLATPNDAGMLTLWGEGTEMAFFKSKAWRFQKEYRFVVMAFSGPVHGYQGDAQAYLQARREWLHAEGNQQILSGAPSILHLDLKLTPEALNSASVSVGPLAPAGTMEMVEALVAKFSPSIHVKPSTLSGTIRSK